jgi:hypothetical protein
MNEDENIKKTEKSEHFRYLSDSVLLSCGEIKKK